MVVLPKEFVKKAGLVQISLTLLCFCPIIHDVFAKNEQSVADYRGGKQNAAKALVGQLMKATKGQANPTVAQKLLYQELDNF